MPDSQSPTLPASKTPTPSTSVSSDLRASPRVSTTPPLSSSTAQMPANLSTFDVDRDDDASPSLQAKDDDHLHHRSPSPHTPPLMLSPKASIKPQSIDALTYGGANNNNGITVNDKNSPNPQQFCLRWNNYQSNLTNVFDQLLQNESFVDVTLACDGNSIKAHKMVLSACSPYFQSLFFDNPCQHPIVIMRDVKWQELTAVVEFMYKGEINVRQEQIAPLLRVAEMLKIRGLADVKGDLDLNSESEKATAATPSATNASATSAVPEIAPIVKKPRITARTEWQINNLDLSDQQSNLHLSQPQQHHKQQRGGDQSLSSASSTSSSQQTHSHSSSSSRHFSNRKRRCPSNEAIKRNASASPLDHRSDIDASPVQQSTSSHPSIPFLTAAGSIDAMAMGLGLNPANAATEDCEIKPGIAEMIREEERVSLESFFL